MNSAAATALQRQTLTTKEASEVWGFSVHWFTRVRVTGGGPKFIKTGNSVRYRVSDLEEYFASRVLDSTSGKHKGRRGRKPRAIDSP